MSMAIRKTNIIAAGIILSLTLYSCQKEVFVENADEEITSVAKVTVNSNPVGAKIYLDNKYTGKSTPDTIKWLSSDQHKVTLKFELIKDTSILVTPAAATVKSVYVDYFSSPRNYGAVQCESTPSNASIYVNGVSQNKSTPYKVPYLFPGIYNIKLKYPGYRDDSSAVTIYGGSSSYMKLTLQDTSTWIDYRLTNSNIPNNKIVAIDVDNSNNIWVGTLDFGIGKFSKGKFTRYNTSNSQIPYDFVTCLKMDKFNNVWIGTTQGLAKFDGVNWTVYKSGQTPLPANYISSLYAAPDGTVWIGTEKGLAQITGNTITSFPSTISPLLQNYVAGITLDSSGRLWVSSVGGISVMNKGAWVTYTRSNHGLVGFDGGPITADQSGNVWCGFPESPKAGIFGGLMKFDGSSWREVAVPAIPKGQIQSLFVDSYGNKWIGSAIGFLIIKTDNSQKIYKSTDYSMFTYDVRGTLIDKDNNAWIALYGGGILKWKKPYN